MSTTNRNHTDMICEPAADGKSCKVKNAKANHNSNNNVEFASEFHLNGQLGNKKSSAFEGSEFEPNEQGPVSERTAWN